MQWRIYTVCGYTRICCLSKNPRVTLPTNWKRVLHALWVYTFHKWLRYQLRICGLEVLLSPSRKTVFQDSSCVVRLKNHHCRRQVLGLPIQEFPLEDRFKFSHQFLASKEFLTLSMCPYFIISCMYKMPFYLLHMNISLIFSKLFPNTIFPIWPFIMYPEIFMRNNINGVCFLLLSLTVHISVLLEWH
jgi:hypothetical protein